MNKKYYYGLFAAGMLFATSCSNDELTQVQSGEYAEVSISLGVEEVAGSRAISDGKGANELHYAVFDAQGKRIEGIKPVQDKEVTFPTTETLTLAKGQTYKVAFWAQNKACQAYTVSPEMNVTVDYDGVNNDETRDAFFKTIEFTVNGSTALDVELTRPFAQINVGVDAADWNAAVASGVEIEESNVIIENAATSINLVTGKVDGSVKVEYTTEAIPAEPLKANNSTYNWLSMSYILVNDGSETGNAETTLKSLKYTFTPKLGNPITFKDGLNNVPVKRNWRTNILGKILTGDITFNISIDPIYEDDKNYPDGSMEQQLEMAATFGGTVTLTSDVELKAPLEVVSNMVLDLNGHSITGAYSKSEGAIIKNNVSLKLVGGTISSTGANGGSAIANYGELVVEGTEIIGASTRENEGWPAYPINNYGDMTLKNATITGYQGAVACGEAGTTILENCTINKEYLNTSSHVFYIYHKDAHVIVNGGTYTHKGMDGSLAYVNSGSITVNDGTFSTTGGGYGMASLTNGKVVINGGSFAAMPINWGGSIILNGGTFNKEPKADWIATGFKSIENNGIYYVVADDVTAVATTQEELATAIQENSTILLGAGNYAFPEISKEGVTLVCEEGTVFEGKSGLNINGATVVGATFSNPDDVAVVGTIHGTFKNCVFEGSEALRWCYSEVGKPVVFENCEIKTDFRGFHFDGMKGDVIFRNCKINGFNAYGGEGTITFEGCTFGNDESSYNGLNIYANTILKNCKFVFESGKTNFIDMEGIGKTLSITNCTATIDGAAADIKSYIGGSKKDQNTITLDGVTL